MEPLIGFGRQTYKESDILNTPLIFEATVSHPLQNTFVLLKKIGMCIRINVNLGSLHKRQSLLTKLSSLIDEDSLKHLY